jgi:DNA-binding NtrC family response regulator
MAIPFTLERNPRTRAAEEPKRAATPAHIDPDLKAKIRVFVVDDEHTLRETCATVLRQDGYDVTVSGRGQDALELLRRRPFDIALVDLYMQPVDGLTLLRAALETNPECVVIVMTGNPTVDSSVEALRLGAFDYLPKPFSATHLEILIGRAMHTLLVARETRDQQSQRDRDATPSDRITLLGTAPAFRQAVELARKVAQTDASVFITGESGSGKELIAQFIHQNSRRASREFVALNCAALPEGLLESEMFGHRKGAFTGAVRDKPGLLETASGGTLFLDELVDMPKAIQAKLLRVIQDGVVRRVGSERPTRSSTSGSLLPPTAIPKRRSRRADAGRPVLPAARRPIIVPPLRDRQEDIPLLAEYFPTTYWAGIAAGARPPPLTERDLVALRHQWRGNVRELQNAIERVVVVAAPAPSAPRICSWAATRRTRTTATSGRSSRRCSRRAITWRAIASRHSSSGSTSHGW